MKLNLRITGEIFEWRGPAPFHFVRVPEVQSRKIKSIANAITYGWGVIPTTAKLGKTEWTTALFPKDGLYLIPVKDIVRKSEDLEIGDEVTIFLSVGPK